MIRLMVLAFALLACSVTPPAAAEPTSPAPKSPQAPKSTEAPLAPKSTEAPLAPKSTEAPQPPKSTEAPSPCVNREDTWWRDVRDPILDATSLQYCTGADCWTLDLAANTVAAAA
jgi:hypothetical protein